MREPDYINELGVKWWKDQSATDYASVLKDAVVWYLHYPNGRRTYALLIENKPVFESEAIADVGKEIDRRKFEEMKSGRIH